MIRNWAKKTLYISGLVVQLALIIGVFLIESLTKKKAGVMHHVYYRKYEYEQTMFTEFNMNIHRIAIALVALIMILLLARSIKKSKEKFLVIQTAIGVILAISTLLISYFFADKIAYYYFIIAFELALAIQFCVVIVLKRIETLQNRKKP